MVDLQKIDCLHNNAVMELMRGLRNQLTELISGLAVQDLAPMSLGLSHSLSRYKLKFSPDKVKLAKIVQDNIQYAKVVKLMGNRTNAVNLDFSEVLSEETEAELKEAAVISMGTEVSDLDLANIKELCDQVLALSEYRAQLYDYLKSRMNTIAPNLTALVGELVGARLIAHGGSLLNLAKQPGSTVQILGAEKLEARLRVLEGRELGRSAGSTKGKPKIEFYDKARKKGAGALITPAKVWEATLRKKRKHEEAELEPTGEASEDPPVEEGKGEGEKRKKKKKKVELGSTGDQISTSEAEEQTKKKKKKKKDKTPGAELVNQDNIAAPESEEELSRKEKKKKKKKKQAEEEEAAGDTSNRKKDKKKKDKGL
ncbi:hypothetical protein GW17_00024974 [Ensete ventricosum]|nr:hypothetical protein GW17_00024974 [Ensete ventricosum]